MHRTSTKTFDDKLTVYSRNTLKLQSWACAGFFLGEGPSRPEILIFFNKSDPRVLCDRKPIIINRDSNTFSVDGRNLFGVPLALAINVKREAGPIKPMI